MNEALATQADVSREDTTLPRRSTILPPPFERTSGVYARASKIEPLRGVDVDETGANDASMPPEAEGTIDDGADAADVVELPSVQRDGELSGFLSYDAIVRSW